MAHFILMLTKDDCTVPNALEVYEEIHDTALAHVGFKDIGLSLDEMKALVARIHADDRRAMLEVVSTSREEELRSVRAAIEIGVDYLLGGRYVLDALPLLASTSIRYFPFCGKTVGHPTRLVGTIDETVADACRLAQLPGVHGLDLLAYRFAGDAPELTRRVVEAMDIPVLAAGSIDRPERVRAVCDAGVWGFTVGSALFEGKFVTNLLQQQIRSLVQMDGVSE
jgi:Histidine biosynthesis protein